MVTHCDQNDWDQKVVFDGDITVDADWRNTRCNTHLLIPRGRRVVFNRPLKTSSACYCETSGSSGTAELVFNAKLDVGDRFRLASHMHATLNAPTNRLNGNSGGISGTLRCGVPYAIAEKNGAGTRTELFVYATGVLDLGGHDQATGLLCAMGEATGGTVTSERPATLHLVDSYLVDAYDSWVKDASGTKIRAPGHTNTLVYAGAVTLSKEGAFTNRLTRTSPTTGALVVRRGRLEFAPGAAWPRATALAVCDTGVFVLEARSTPPFSAETDLQLDRTASLHLDAPLEVRALYLDGKQQRLGIWGGAAAAAAHPTLGVRVLPGLTGPGLLHVRTSEGSVLVLR